MEPMKSTASVRSSTTCVMCRPSRASVHVFFPPTCTYRHTIALNDHSGSLKKSILLPFDLAEIYEGKRLGKRPFERDFPVEKRDPLVA